MATKDAATQPGAAEGTQPTAPILRPSRREAIESIGKRRVENFNKEQKEAGSSEFVPVTGELSGDEVDELDADPDDAAVEAERARLKAESERVEAEERAAKEKAAKAPKTEIDKQLEADDRVTVIDDPSKYRVKLKVDGEDRVVDLADVVRVGQKDAAADRRMEAATALLKTADARVAEADKRLADANDAEKAKAERDLKAAQEAKEQASKDLTASLKEYNDLLYDGKTEEAAKVMTKILEPVRRSEPAATHEPAKEIDVKALKKEVKAELKQELKSESAMETFAGAYPEIVADQSLAEHADRLFMAAREEGKSEAEAFKAAGDETRAWVKGMAKSLGMDEARTTTTRRESLDKRKETIDEPETASLGTSLKDGSPPEGNPRSTIAEMAAMRPAAMAAAAAAKRQAGGG